MKVALIRYHDIGDINTRLPASLNNIRGVVPPLGLCYIAACLERAGHKVQIADAQICGYSQNDLYALLQSFKPDVAGITTMTSNFRGALEAAHIAKSCGCMTVVGGPNVEIFPKESLSHSDIDYGIGGEGENSFICLLDALENRRSLRDVPGVVYRLDHEIIINAPAIVKDIDSLPLPARHLLPIRKYTSLISHDPMTTMISSRGCPYSCAFCFKQAADTLCRFRNPVAVVDEMELLTKDFGIREIMFYDDTIVTRRSHIEGICNEIIRRNLKIRWESPSRVNSIDAPLLALMKRSGCIRLRYGVESGDPDILKRMNKQISIDQVKKVFTLTRKAGIEAFGYFITGYPGETRRQFECTLRVIKSIKADQIMITLTTPYPGTPLEKECIASHSIPEDYWKNFILGNQQVSMPVLVDGAERWIAEAYRKFYFNPVYIVKRLRHIDSWRQLKKHIQAVIALLFLKFRSTQY
jgi:radical SAM superfamily enzyme YgiQ (UPF0313 family)